MAMQLYFIRILKEMLSIDKHICDLTFEEERKLQFPKISSLDVKSDQLEYAVKKELDDIILEHGLLSSLTKLYILQSEIEEKIKGYPKKENPYIFLRISCKQTIDSITRIYLSNVALKFYWACTKIKEKVFDPQECAMIFKKDPSVLAIADSIGLPELDQMSLYEKEPLELEDEQRLKKELGEYYQYKERKSRAFSNNRKIINQIKRKLLNEFTVEELKEMYDLIRRSLIELDDSPQVKAFFIVLHKAVAIICHEEKRVKSEKTDLDQTKLPGF